VRLLVLLHQIHTWSGNSAFHAAPTETRSLGGFRATSPTVRVSMECDAVVLEGRTHNDVLDRPSVLRELMEFARGGARKADTGQPEP
jgi:hypothetical protein